MLKVHQSVWGAERRILVPGCVDGGGSVGRARLFVSCFLFVSCSRWVAGRRPTPYLESPGDKAKRPSLRTYPATYPGDPAWGRTPRPTPRPTLATHPGDPPRSYRHLAGVRYLKNGSYRFLKLAESVYVCLVSNTGRVA